MMKPILKIFVAQHCPGCIEARKTATLIEQDYPDLTVQLIDIDNEQDLVPETVFATPTYMLNNRIVSLGNPNPAEIVQWAAEVATQQVER